MGIGTPELIVLVLVALSIAVAALPFILRKRYPDRLWLGIVLCILNSGMGQFYLFGGLRYFIGLFVLFIICRQFLGNGYGWMISVLASVGIMYWRFVKASENPWLERNNVKPAEPPNELSNVDKVSKDHISAKHLTTVYAIYAIYLTGELFSFSSRLGIVVAMGIAGGLGCLIGCASETVINSLTSSRQTKITQLSQLV